MWRSRSRRVNRPCRPRPAPRPPRPYIASKPPAGRSAEHRAADPGACPEVGEVGKGLSGHDRGHLGLADPLDLGECRADRVPTGIGQIAMCGCPVRVHLMLLGRSTTKVSFGGVDVEAEDGDAQIAGVVEDEAFGIHPRVVGEHPGEEGRRVVGLEPGRVEGRQREAAACALQKPKLANDLSTDQISSRSVAGVTRALAAGATGPRCPPGPAMPIVRRTSSACARDFGRLGDDLEHLLVKTTTPSVSARAGTRSGGGIAFLRQPCRLSRRA